MTREELIEQIDNLLFQTEKVDFLYSEAIADWVIEDRKRIVAPLVKYKFLDGMNLKNTRIQFCEEAINKTIELARIEEGK